MSSRLAHRAFSVLVAVALLLTLTACGGKDEKKVATQVAAKVDSEEVSVHQINQVLSRTNAAGATPQILQGLRREVLEKLIDQQLAVNQATELKLHRSPEVLAQLEAARREVLARAYIQQIVNSLSKPTQEETRKYYVEHPQLFSERRVYNLQEILIPSAIPLTEGLRGQVAAGKSMEDIAAWLKSKDVKFSGGVASRAAEQIPLELLAKVHAMKDGQTTVIQSPQALTILRVASSQSAPVNEVNALPRIEQFLSNQRGAEAVAKNTKDLRAKATVVYMGDFAPAAGAVGTVAPASAPPVTAMSSTPATPPATQTSAAGSSTLSNTAIEKGLGLK